MDTVKYLGRDCELSTTGVDADRRAVSSWEVTRRVLAQIDAAFAPLGTRTWSHRPGPARGHDRERSGSAYSADCLRHWAPNGQCYYSDLAHVEVCTAECRTPYEFAAQSWSTLLVVEAARRRAQELAPPGTRYLLAASNVDALDPGVSWGTHLNVAVSPQLFADLLLDAKRPAVLAFVASALAAAMPFFGAGYVLPLRDGSCRYSLSARAHHVTRVVCDSTTTPFERGLLNTRREAHAAACDRLHLIGFDFALASAALLAAFVQACFAAAEAGYVGPVLLAPLQALHAWSLGFDQERGAPLALAKLVDGREVTLGAYVRELALALLRLCDEGTIKGAVAPSCAELLPRIAELAERVDRGDLAAGARHLDWAAKLVVLRQSCHQRGVGLDDDALRLLDHDFAATDPARSPLFKLWRRGLLDPLVDGAAVEACLRDGPTRNRGWARGRLIQRFCGTIDDVDWDHVELALTDERFGPRVRVDMPDPGGCGRDEFEPLLAGAADVHDLAATVRRAQRADAGTKTASFTPTTPLGDLRREVRFPWPPPPSGDGHANSNRDRP